MAESKRKAPKPEQTEARITLNLPDVAVDFRLSDEQRKNIQSCLEKGTLKLSLKDVDITNLGKGLLSEGYLWD